MQNKTKEQLGSRGVSLAFPLQWYRCKLEKLPEELSWRFVQLEPDEDTLEFLERSEEKSDWILTQLWHSLAKAFLSFFMTQTSINGWVLHPYFIKTLFFINVLYNIYFRTTNIDLKKTHFCLKQHFVLLYFLCFCFWWHLPFRVFICLCTICPRCWIYWISLSSTEIVGSN